MTSKDFFLGIDWAHEKMDDDDFVEKLSEDSASKPKSVSRSDAKFAQYKLHCLVR